MKRVVRNFRAIPSVLRGLFFFWLGFWSLVAFVACTVPKPQKGGGNTISFGGASSPTSVTTTAPENPRTPSTTTVEKTVTRTYARSVATPAPTSTAPATNPVVGSVSKPALSGAAAFPAPDPAPVLVSETVVERASTQLGSSWEDKARELGVKLANMRGVMWAGVLLLVGGPIVGFKMGWPTNGIIAGLTGLGLIILAQVVPGNEAWFGLGGLLLIPLVAYAWYHGHHTAAAELTPPPS